MEVDSLSKITKKALITLLIVIFFDIILLTLFMLISWVLRLFPLSEIRSLGSLNMPVLLSLIFSTITGITITIWTHDTLLKKILYGMLTTLITLIPLFYLNAVIGGVVILMLLSLS